MLRRSVAGLVVAIALSACGGDRLTPPLKAETPDPGFVDQTVLARLTMEVKGAEQIEVETQTKLRIVEILGGKTPTVTWFVSISAGEQVKLDDGRTLQFTADLTPGVYRGKGTYKLDDKGGVEVEGQRSPLGSASYVSFLNLGPPPKLSRYDQLKKPCTLTVAEDVVSGSVDCPSLGGEKGKTVSARWSWERI